MNKEEIEFFETRIPILRRHYVLVSEFNGQINEEETKKLFDYIRELRVKNHKLKQQNQQLTKERNKMACLVNDLQETLEEIREYIKETLELKEEYPEEVECVVNDLLQIIDKGVNNDL